MGVPKFFRWLAKTCPKMIRPLTFDSMAYVDNFYLDMNGIIHNCRNDVSSEGELIQKIFQYIEDLVSMVRPSKYLFMALDGVPPAAKMMQQRQRRFQYLKSKRESTTSTDIKEKSLNVSQIAEEVETMNLEQLQTSEDEKVKEELETILQHNFEEKKDDFNSLSITPGTNFMFRLSFHFRYFIQMMIQTNFLWKGITVIFSGAEVAGEGEHKIMDFIRLRQKNRQLDEPAELHCLFGQDADLIMLALSTHEPKFTVLREAVFLDDNLKFLKRKSPKFQKKEDQFHLIEFSVLREFINSQFYDIRHKFIVPYDLTRIIDDFIVMLFLCGNDFLPALPTLDIGEGALDYFFSFYKELLPSLNGYITNRAEGSIDFIKLSHFLKALASLEQPVLQKRLHLIKRMNYYLLEMSPTVEKITTSQENTIEQIEVEEEENRIIDNQWVNLLHFICNDQIECLNAKESSHLLYVLQGKPDSNITSDSDEQLLLKIQFKENIKLHSIMISGPESSAPKSIKLFVNQPNLDFEEIEKVPVKQKLTLSKNQLSQIIPLEIVKFQNVSHLTILVESNLENEENTVIEKISFFGVPIGGLDLTKLKKIPRWKKTKKNKTSERTKSQKKSINDIPNHYILTKYLIQMKGNLDTPISIPLWKEMYYKEKLHFDSQDKLSRDRLITKYLEGLLWVFQYYYQGCKDWEWYYPYHYAPITSDIISFDLSRIQFQSEPQPNPVRPFEMLLTVLPPTSHYLLPSIYHGFDQIPSLKPFFPETIEIDNEGKKNKWEATLLVPFVDTKILKQEMEKIEKNSSLKEEEKLRDQFGDISVFKLVSNEKTKESIKHKVESILPNLFPELNDCYVKEGKFRVFSDDLFLDEN